MEFKHPNYYKELRKRNKELQAATLDLAGAQSDQVISKQQATASSERAPDPGLRSYPLSGNGGKLDSLQTLADKTKASSFKRQASSFKAFEPTWLSIKRQASSPKQQASSFKPEAASSVILDPWNMDIGEVLGDKGPRAFIMIKELLG